MTDAVLVDLIHRLAVAQKSHDKPTALRIRATLYSLGVLVNLAAQAQPPSARR